MKPPAGVPKDLALKFGRTSATDWVGRYEIAVRLRELGLHPDLALDHETARARLMLRSLAQKRAVLTFEEAMALKVKKRLWEPTSLNSFYVPTYEAILRRANRYIEAAYCFDSSLPSQWPILVDGRHLPIAMIHEVGGAQTLAYTTDRRVADCAIVMMEQPWRLFYSEEVESGTIMDLDDIDDDEYEELLGLNEVEPSDEDVMRILESFDRLDRDRAARWADQPTPVSMR